MSPGIPQGKRKPERLLESQEGKRTGAYQELLREAGFVVENKGDTKGGVFISRNRLGAVGWKIHVIHGAMTTIKERGSSWCRGFWLKSNLGWEYTL